MDINTGTVISGFTVTNIRELPENEGRLVEMIHKESGAGLCWIDNGINNKLFSVAFRTLPENDTGVFHILEHSVLCGSAKYPVKDPFLDLLKGSVQTFLNAMTYPDKTLYPVSSRSEQDYLNLTSVYLDAVFAPRLLTEKNIFMQEGWHIEKDENGSPLYNGVVFNEMKGAFSDVDDLIETELCRLMFPDTPYGKVSGGDPVSIPDLTYEQFCDTWRRFYHPSNALFFLDGAVPLEKTLDMINGYLSDCGDAPAVPDFTAQKPVSRTNTVKYPINEEEKDEDRTHFVMSKLTGMYSDKLEIFASDVLADYLTNNNESPLSKALLEAGLGQDVVALSTSGVYQTYFSVTVRNLRDSAAEEAKELIFATVDRLLSEGLDKEMLLSFISHLEFEFRLTYEPSGLVRCGRVFDSWLYGGDPMLFLDNTDVFAKLREMVENGGFEELLRRLFDREDLCFLTMQPDTGLSRQQADEEAAGVKARVDAMSEAQLLQTEKESAALLEWQQTPDTDEARGTIPMLTLDELGKEPEKIETEILEENGVKVVHYIVQSSGITHFMLLFDLGQIDKKTLTQLRILPVLLSDLPTKRHSLPELQKLIKAHIGLLSFPIAIFDIKDDDDHCRPMLTVNCSVLDAEVGNAIEIITEILTETDFSRTDLIKSLLLQKQDSDRQRCIVSGHSQGITETAAHYSAAGAAKEYYEGVSAMKELHRILDNYDAEAETLISTLQDVLDRTVCMKRLTVSATTDNYNGIVRFLRFREGEAVEPLAEYTTDISKKIGISVPSGVSYAVQSTSLPGVNGSMIVASQIMTLDCLWNIVRVQGGAYGSGLKTSIDRKIACYSYRDPSPARTLDVYKQLAGHLEKWCESGESLDKYIISTVSAIDPLLSPKNIGSREISYYFSGRTFDDIAELRRQMILADREAILGFCDSLRKLGEEGAVCVTGSPDALAEIEGLEIVKI